MKRIPSQVLALINRYCWLTFLAITFAGCATEVHPPSIVGTWKDTNKSNQYYLRLYADGRAAIWPSPPQDKTGWASYHDGKLDLGYESQGLRVVNPNLFLKGNLLVIQTPADPVSGQLENSQYLARLPNDLVPP